MLTEIEIIKIANDYLKKKEQKGGIELAIQEELSIKKNYGIIFSYNSKEYIETKDEGASLIGNSSFLVENKTGKIVVFGTNRSDDYYIQEYEAGRWPDIIRLSDLE
ncbi:YrhB domain-containing protein [uncultured Chryseobacterium sp.]|uniref:YrhB domain-containing protein n=1 Tax=uncultured Chryseobacterium sp. TaxID=259322 RepID=UPI00258A9ADE|nr:YrhB domain-containing protein [uncultured Chryseobacterium sp.]